MNVPLNAGMIRRAGYRVGAGNQNVRAEKFANCRSLIVRQGVDKTSRAKVLLHLVHSTRRNESHLAGVELRPQTIRKNVAKRIGILATGRFLKPKTAMDLRALVAVCCAVVCPIFAASRSAARRRSSKIPNAARMRTMAAIATGNRQRSNRAVAAIVPTVALAALSVGISPVPPGDGVAVATDSPRKTLATSSVLAKRRSGVRSRQRATTDSQRGSRSGMCRRGDGAI